MTRVHGDELPASPLFGGVKAGDWAELLAQAVRLDLDAGMSVFLQGKPADSFYAILSGAVEVRIKSPNSPERVVAGLNEGAVLGETSLFLGGEHSASVITTEPCTLLQFRTDAFLQMIEEKQTGAILVLYNMGIALAGRLRSADQDKESGPKAVASGTIQNTRDKSQRFLR